MILCESDYEDRLLLRSEMLTGHRGDESGIDHVHNSSSLAAAAQHLTSRNCMPHPVIVPNHITCIVNEPSEMARV